MEIHYIHEREKGRSAFQGGFHPLGVFEKNGLRRCRTRIWTLETDRLAPLKNVVNAPKSNPDDRPKRRIAPVECRKTSFSSPPCPFFSCLIHTFPGLKASVMSTLSQSSPTCPFRATNTPTSRRFAQEQTSGNFPSPSSIRPRPRRPLLRRILYLPTTHPRRASPQATSRLHQRRHHPHFTIPLTTHRPTTTPALTSRTRIRS